MCVMQASWFCADSEPSRAFHRVPAGRQYQHAKDLFNAKDKFTHEKPRGSLSSEAHSTGGHRNGEKKEPMHGQLHGHASYGPMHLQAPAEASFVSQQPIPRKKLPEASLQSSLEPTTTFKERSIHEETAVGRVSVACMGEPRRALDQSIEAHKHAREQAMHVMHEAEDDESGSDDSYAWAQRKAEMQSKGGWRGAPTLTNHGCNHSNHSCGTLRICNLVE